MIQVTDLTKSFSDKKRGVVKAVDGISFTCRPGEIYGLLGPNGAGKTTTLRLLSTVLEPDSGTAVVAGHDLLNDPGGVRASIGFLSGDTGLYRRLSAREILRYFASLYGMTGAAFQARLEVLTGLLEMGEFLDAKTDKLSTGQKQRVSIARTVIHDPPVLILDEPTAGLDIIASRAIIEFIARARAAQKTILFSTHVMREAERLCDRVGIIHRGRLAAQGTLEELRRQFGSPDLEEVFVRAVGLDPAFPLHIKTA
ncbi:MAG: ATP-binding cassette domain-containing protein [Candidatus Zixiibacteriota bacterium]|nr:MAG: ATP-binding cassette domain-containing protein [candidate division Zixibacteria bacterium]